MHLSVRRLPVACALAAAALLCAGAASAQQPQPSAPAPAPPEKASGELALPPSGPPAPGAPVTPPGSEPVAAPQPTALPAKAPPGERPAPAAPPPGADKNKDKDPGASDVVVSVKPGRGLTVKRRDDLASLTVRSRIQIRNTVKSTGAETTNELNVKTLRFYLQGNVLSPDLKYFVQLAFGGNDYEAGSATPLFDAFVEYTRLRDLQLRVGQFFVPFDRARTIREFALQLVDRPQVVTELTLDRDAGVMLSSEDLFGANKVLSYNLGVFGGEGRNRFGGAAPGFLYVLRLAVRPLGAFDDDLEGDLERLRRPRLALGGAVAYNHNTNRVRSTTGNPLTLGTVNYLHAAGDLVFKYAGLSVLAEAVYRRGSPDFREGEVDGAMVREWSRTGAGYLIQAGMMVNPWLEVVGRWDHLIGQDSTDPTLNNLVADQGHELGAGLNLYLNGHLLKLQADYARLFGEDYRKGVHLGRVQLDASF